MEFRPYYLAREWVRAGHRVQIVAADYSHVRARQPEAGDESIDGIDYRWYRTPRYRGNGLGRVRNIAAFLRRGLGRHAAAGCASSEPDVVIASSTYPMDIWVGAPARAARAARGWSTRCTTCGRCRRSSCRACRRATRSRCCARRPRTTPTATPTPSCRCCRRCTPTWPRTGSTCASCTIVPNGIALDEWQRDGRRRCATTSPRRSPPRARAGGTRGRLRRLDGRAERARHAARCGRAAARRAAALRARRRRPRARAARAARRRRSAGAASSLLPPMPEGADAGVAGRRSTSPTSAGSGCRSTASASRRTS